jgi:hypothetical protein
MSRTLKRNALPKSASAIAVVVASALVVILPAIAGTASTGPRAEKDSQSKAPTAKKDAQAKAPKTDGKKKVSGSEITSLPFGELNNGKPFNASGGVDLGEGRALICDNKTKRRPSLSCTSTGPLPKWTARAKTHYRCRNRRC